MPTDAPKSKGLAYLMLTRGALGLGCGFLLTPILSITGALGAYLIGVVILHAIEGASRD